MLVFPNHKTPAGPYFAPGGRPPAPPYAMLPSPDSASSSPAELPPTGADYAAQWQQVIAKMPSYLDANGASGAFNPATFNRPTYTYRPLTSKPYSVDQLASRWQGQLGLRYSF